MAEKPIFVMCYCTGECPGFQKLNLWQMVNRVRNEKDVELAIIHPQLCVDDGDRFWQYFGKPNQQYVVGGCDPRMQHKMFKDTLEDIGIEFDKQVYPLDLRDMETEEALSKVDRALEAITI